MYTETETTFLENFFRNLIDGKDWWGGWHLCPFLLNLGG